MYRYMNAAIQLPHLHYKRLPNPITWYTYVGPDRHSRPRPETLPRLTYKSLEKTPATQKSTTKEPSWTHFVTHRARVRHHQLHLLIRLSN